MRIQRKAAAFPGGVICQKLNGTFIIGIGTLAEKVTDRSIYPKLFLHFSNQTLLWGLIALDFAPRKFPFTGQIICFPALGDQDSVIAN